MAEIREKPTVAGRELLQEAGFEMFHHLMTRMPDIEEATLADLKTVDIKQLDGRFVGASHRLQRAAIVALLRSWSLPAPLPTMDTIGDMELDVYDALAVATAPLVQVAMFGENFGPSGATDPASPTVPSSGSEPGERAQTVPSAGPTDGPSDSSVSTGTGVPSAV